MRQSRQQLSVSPTTTASSVYRRSSSNSNSSTPLLGQEEGITTTASTATTTTTPDSTTSTMLSRSFSTSNSEEDEEASSGKENNSVVDTPSAWKELHSEVRRINARADELMDSFRRMANEEPSSNRSSSMDSNTPERPSRGDFFVDTFDDNNDNEDEDPHNPVLSRRSRRSTPSSSSPSADVGDDSMNDELDRLEEATAVIRESLDRSDGLTESQLHSLLWSPNNNNDMTSPSPRMNNHSHSSSQNQQQQPTPPLFSSSERASPHILATTTLFSTSTDCGSPNQTMSTHESTLKPTTTTTTNTSSSSSSPPSSLCSTPPDQLVESGHGMGTSEALLLAVTVVWAAIVVALVQARYCLLDEDGFLFTVT